MPPALSRSRSTFRLLALLFAAFLVFVIVTADLGVVDRLFGWMIAFPNGDKAGHFGLYGAMALLLSFGFPTTRVGLPFLGPLKRGPLVSALLLAAAAALEELSQFFFPGRSPSWLDLVAGVAGVFLFSELGAWIVKRLPLTRA